MTLIVGLVLGSLLGASVMGFTAIGSFERGFTAAMQRVWREELARRTQVHRSRYGEAARMLRHS